MAFDEPWSGRRGSNPQPIAWKAIALPIELLPLVLQNLRIVISHFKELSGQSRVRTYVLVREQIYSLSPLTTRPSALLEVFDIKKIEPKMGLEPATY